MHQDDKYIARCIILAQKAQKNTFTNPMVGAVLVYNDTVIGEGYHEKYGQAHAEVNAINAVKDADRHLIAHSTLYVSLEPCSHTGKTPPCAHRIVEEKIPKVVIGCLDPNPLVAGNGIRYLTEHGVDVRYPVLGDKASDLIRKFKCNLMGLPFIILKWAQTADYYISKTNSQTWLSNEYSKVLTHQWRSEVDGIMIGRKTAEIDNPSLDVRLYEGDSPMRILMDTSLKLTGDYKILNDGAPLIIINEVKETSEHNISYVKVSNTQDIEEVLRRLFSLGMTSILVEGGAALLRSFITSGLWHEARVFRTKIRLGEGVNAPLLEGKLMDTLQLQHDEILFIANPNLLTSDD